MGQPDKQLVTAISDLLDRLADSRKCSKDEQEIVHGQVMAGFRELPRSGIFIALEKAEEKSGKRKKESVYLLSELTDIPEAITRIEKELSDPDPERRRWLIQAIGNRKLVGFAPQLNEIMLHDPDSTCRSFAISAAARLRCQCNLPTIIRLAEESAFPMDWGLVCALKEFATPECEPLLDQVFSNSLSTKAQRVVAAWGLIKLGKEYPWRFLIEMLFDPDEKSANSYRHGESLRAAQAICDLKGWEFRWNKTFVMEHRKIWRDQLLAK